MPVLEPEFPNVSVIFGPLYLLLVALEIGLIRWAGQRGLYERRDAAASISLGFGSLGADLILGGIGAAAVWLAYEARIATIPVTLVTLVVAFLLDDFRYYWWHRFGHRVRWFWASHVVHHSSQHYNLSTALRQPWTSGLSGLFVLSLPLAFVGFHPAVLAFVYGLNLFYQFWIHTETIDRMPGWFEAVLNTPSHHRVHHGTNPRYLDANYAGVLIVWDRWFGTFVPERADDPVEYGLVHNLTTNNPVRIAFHEFVSIGRDLATPDLSIRERLHYLFAAPGWSHDGRRQTSTQLKAAHVAAHPSEAGTPGLPAIASAA